MQKIIVGYGAVKEIADKMECTTRTVHNALKFDTDSEQAKLIRKIAIDEHRGVKIKVKI